MRRLSADGSRVVGEGVTVFEGGTRHPTIERGPEAVQARRLVLHLRAGGRRRDGVAGRPALASRPRALRGQGGPRAGNDRGEWPAPGGMGRDHRRRLVVPPFPGAGSLGPRRAPPADDVERRLARDRAGPGRRRHRGAGRVVGEAGGRGTNADCVSRRKRRVRRVAPRPAVAVAGQPARRLVVGWPSAEDDHACVPPPHPLPGWRCGTSHACSCRS